MKPFRPIAALVSALVCGNLACVGQITSAEQQRSAQDTLLQVNGLYAPLTFLGEGDGDPEEAGQLLLAVQDLQAKGSPAGLHKLEAFVADHPGSPWTASVRFNLARNYEERGLHTLALGAYRESWAALEQATSRAKTLADRCYLHLGKLLASLSRANELEALLVQNQGRELPPGPSKQLQSSLGESLRQMKASPDASFRCGTMALRNVARRMVGCTREDTYFLGIPAPVTGFSLYRLQKIAENAGLRLVAARWGEGQEIIVPSVVHWKQNHFAAVVSRRGDMYLVQDAAFGRSRWQSGADLRLEASGAFLVPVAHLPESWAELDEAEGARIVGKGYVSGTTDENDSCANGSGGGGAGAGNGAGSGGADGTGGFGETASMPPACHLGTCGGGGAGSAGGATGGSGSCETCGAPGTGATGGDPGPFISRWGMPVWEVSEPYINLWLYDEPLGYPMSDGARFAFRLSYKQRELRQLETNSWMFSFGPLWKSSWLSFVVDNNGTTRDAQMILPGGGERSYTADNTSPEHFTQTRLDRKEEQGNFTGFVLSYGDGSKVYYNYVPKSTLELKKVAFLSREVDPHGRETKYEYEELTNGLGTVRLRLVRVIDRDGLTNSLGYGTNDNLVRQVNDPFGNQVTLSYDQNGLLTNIVDVVGLSSSVSYNTFGWATNLTTPYGVTQFLHWTNNLGTNEWDPFPLEYLPIRALKVIDAAGGTNVFMLRQDSSVVYTNVNDLESLNGNVQNNTYLEAMAFAFSPADFPAYCDTDSTAYYGWRFRNSFHWGPRQAQGLPDDLRIYSVQDLARARIRHWLHTDDLGLSQSLAVQIEPSPDGTTYGRGTWFGRTNTTRYLESAAMAPVAVMNTGEGGYQWMRYFARDEWGRPTNVVESYTSPEAGVALLRTNQYIYSPNGIDLLVVIGPTGHTNMAYGYDASHRLRFATNAAGDYQAFYYDPYGRLTNSRSFAGLTTEYHYPASGQYTNWAERVVELEIGRTNTYTYQHNRIRTHTSPSGLSITNTWDALGRLRCADFPDGTRVTNHYSKLDLVRTTDRMGLHTDYSYDALRRRTAVTNAAGAYTLYNYCSCSGLDSVVDAEGNTTSYFYDNAGRPTQTVLPDGFVASFYYNRLNRLTNYIDSTGQNLTSWYNNQGLLCGVSNQFGVLRLATFDVEDHATNVVDANGVVTETTYDDAGRMIQRTMPGFGSEAFRYSTWGLEAHTNQIGQVTWYAYDAAGRKRYETNANLEITEFNYDPSGNLTNLVDAKAQNTYWKYDAYGRVTNKVDHLGTNLFFYGYDANGRLTSRTSAAKGTTAYAYDPVGNLTNINYPVSPDISMAYDRLNRLTNLVDGIGVTKYAYNAAGHLLSEDGPWGSDTVSYTYQNRLRSALNLAHPSGALFSASYGYDAMKRLTNLTSPAGVFGYEYGREEGVVSPASLVRSLTLPVGSITNGWDGAGRLLASVLRDQGSVMQGLHEYAYNPANQRTQHLRWDGSKVAYTYDDIGQLKTATPREADDSIRLIDRFGYAYDPAGNLQYRTNNSLFRTFSVDELNQLTTVTRSGTLTVAGTTTGPATNVTVNGGLAEVYNDNTFARDGYSLVDGTNSFTAIAEDAYGRKDTNTISVWLPASVSHVYDSNGNLLSDGRRGFAYDDENQLITVTVTNEWKSIFRYDGKMRRRERIECTWQSGAWVTNQIVRYVYDGNLVVQERWFAPQLSTTIPQRSVSYTRGKDLSGSLEGAGGIGGLLARTDHSSPRQSEATAGQHSTCFYHCDAVGNVTTLLDGAQQVAARYLYDPFGNILSQAGPLAEENLYRFSSKEFHPQSGLVYYLYRYYEPSLQRWVNRDPVSDVGRPTRLIAVAGASWSGIENAFAVAVTKVSDDYTFVENAALCLVDVDGLRPRKPRMPKLPDPEKPKDFDLPCPEGLTQDCKSQIELTESKVKNCSLENDPMDTFVVVCECLANAVGGSQVDKLNCANQLTKTYEKICP